MAGPDGLTVAGHTVTDAGVTAAIGRDMLTVVQVTAIAQATPIGAERFAAMLAAGYAATLVVEPVAEAPSMLAADSMAAADSTGEAVFTVVAATAAATGNSNQVTLQQCERLAASAVSRFLYRSARRISYQHGPNEASFLLPDR